MPKGKQAPEQVLKYTLMFPREKKNQTELVGGKAGDLTPASLAWVLTDPGVTQG